MFLPSVASAILMLLCISEAVPEKSSFVEYTVQECPEGLTERGTCQRLTLDSDTEVMKTIVVNFFTIKRVH